MQLALSAAPEHLRAQASVYVYGKGGFRLIRRGENGFTCLLNRDAFLYGSDAFKPTCWDREGESSYVEAMLQVGSMLAEGRSAREVRDEVERGFLAGRLRSARRSGVAYMLAGDILLDRSGEIVRRVFPPHYMFYASGINDADIGHARNRSFHLPSIFSDGAGGMRLAYIIVHAAPAE